MLALMLYSALVSSMLAAGVRLVERFVSARRAPTRWLWFAAIVAMVAIVVLPASRPAALPNIVATSAPAASTQDDVVRPGASRQAAFAQPDDAGRAVPLDILLLGAWALASLAGALILAGSAWRIARMQRAWRPAEIGGVPVLLSHDVGPAIVGLFHHGVVMPTWVESLSPTQQRLVVTHEREHVRAGDPLLLWSATFMVVLFPWNPGMWLALRGLRHAIEIDCDARVLRSQPDTHAYCTLLLDVGERTLAGVAPMAALAEPSTLLERRVEVMTARHAPSWKTAANLTAGLVLLVAGCVAPRTAFAPSRDAAALVRDLTGLLQSDAVAASIPQADRERLASRLVPPADDDDGVARRTGDEWEAMLEPSLDDALRQFFPVLFTRKDTARKLVILSYDSAGRLVDHEMLDMPDMTKRNTPPIEGLDVLFFVDRFSTQGKFQWIGHRERASLHTSVLLRAERHAVKATPAAPTIEAFGGMSGSGIAPELQFTRRVDSIARADYPEAFRPHEDAYVVVGLFRQNGEFVRSKARRLPLGEVFDVVPGATMFAMRNSTYVMRLMELGELPQLAGEGSSVMREAPNTAFIWAAFKE